jgi:hypothetical protein
MFPLDQNKVYNYKPEYLAAQEFKRCLSLFEKKNPKAKLNTAMTRFAGVQKLISNAEQPHRQKLQQLAVDTIKEIYQVPDYVDINARINPSLSLDTAQDAEPKVFLELSLEQKNQMRDEIQKRVILNGLVHGSSMHIWKSIHHLVSAEIKDINPQLPELYDYYTSCMSVLLWFVSPERLQDAIDQGIQMTQGYNKLQFNSEPGFGGKIEARGISFPTLIHEVNKGVLDWLISAGIPKKYSEAELEYYYAQADSYENEVYHYLLSPTLWVDLLETVKMDNHDIPKLIRKLSQLSYQDLVELFRLMMDNKEEAKKVIDQWKL